MLLGECSDYVLTASIRYFKLVGQIWACVPDGHSKYSDTCGQRDVDWMHHWISLWDTADHSNRSKRLFSQAVSVTTSSNSHSSIRRGVPWYSHDPSGCLHLLWHAVFLWGDVQGHLDGQYPSRLDQHRSIYGRIRSRRHHQYRPRAI